MFLMEFVIFETVTNLLPVNLYGKLRTVCNAIIQIVLINCRDTRFGYLKGTRHLSSNFQDFGVRLGERCSPANLLKLY